MSQSLTPKDKHAQYLYQVWKHGTLSTSEIREKTDLSGQDVRNRHRKFTNLNYISKTKIDAPEDEQYDTISIVELTQKGETKINEGKYGVLALDEDTDTSTADEDIEERLQDIEEQFENIQERFDSIESEFENVAEWIDWVDEWSQSVEDRLDS